MNYKNKDLEELNKKIKNIDDQENNSNRETHKKG